MGIAPLQVKEGTASFIGSADVCDYLDFVVTPGMEADFFNVLLDDLRGNGIKRLDLESLRPDSAALMHLTSVARRRGYAIVCEAEDVSLELALPATWDEYLAMLTTKQRHEVRRKLRRLSEVARVSYRFIQDGASLPGAIDTFLKMFTGSREDKAAFLTPRTESFFRELADTMGRAGMLRLGVLELDGLPAAMIMCFAYDSCLYLYNSGYDLRYTSLSVGLLSKVMAIKNSIEQGMSRFDFLKGNEVYKYHLGGREVPIYRCQIVLN